MLKFFRKIRQSLVSDGKFGKYLLYALGEIILVVIGILIAIQLNTWNTEADEKVRILKYMDGLSSELQQDHQRMDSLYTFYSIRTNYIQLLLKSRDQNSNYSNDELGLMFNAVLEHKKFSNKKSTYLTLINDGFINKLDNKELVNEIVKYYETPFLTWSTEIYGNLYESINYNESEFYNTEDGLIELSKQNSIPNWELTSLNFETDYKELLDSKWAINILTSFLKQSDFIYSNLDIYREMNVRLRKEIDDYRNEG